MICTKNDKMVIKLTHFFVNDISNTLMNTMCIISDQLATENIAIRCIFNEPMVLGNIKTFIIGCYFTIVIRQDHFIDL